MYIYACVFIYIYICMYIYIYIASENDAAGPLKLQQRGVPKVPPDNFPRNHLM